MKNKEEMLMFFKKKTNIERLSRDENIINISKNDTGYISYLEFLKYFSDLNKITRHNVIIGINLVYAWMPTIFNFRSNDIDSTLNILNKAKKGEVPSENDLNVLIKCFNNSLVGTSKLLHIINPEVFAIWDSRVFHYLTNKKPYPYKINNCKWFLDYLKFCKHITKNPKYVKIHESIVKKVGYEMSKFRTLELIMYLSDMKKSAQRKSGK